MFQQIPCDLVQLVLVDFIGIACLQLSVLDVAFCERASRSSLLALLPQLEVRDDRNGVTHGSTEDTLLGNFLLWVAHRNIRLPAVAVHIGAIKPAVRELQEHGVVGIQQVKTVELLSTEVTQLTIEDDRYIGILLGVFPALTAVQCSGAGGLVDSQLLQLINLPLERLSLTGFLTSPAICRVLSTMFDTLLELDCQHLDNQGAAYIGEHCHRLRRLAIYCADIEDTHVIEHMCFQLGEHLEHLQLSDGAHVLTSGALQNTAKVCPELRTFIATCEDPSDASAWNSFVAHCPLLDYVCLSGRCAQAGSAEITFAQTQGGARTCRFIWALPSNAETMYCAFCALVLPMVTHLSIGGCGQLSADCLRLITDKFGSTLEAFRCCLVDASDSDEAIIYFLSRCPNLMGLAWDCSECHFTDACLQTIADCCVKLTHLSVQNSRISDAGVIAMLNTFKQRKTSVSSLSLDNCVNLTDTTLFAIADAFPQGLDDLLVCAKQISKETMADLILTGRLRVHHTLVTMHAPWVEDRLKQAGFKCMFTFAFLVHDLI